MKIRSFILAAAAAALASCAGKVSEVTEITGTFGEDVPAEVKFVCGDIDTTVVVENGTFNIAIPTDRSKCAFVVAGRARAIFIPDGTKITVDFAPELPTAVSSCSKSINFTFKEAMAYYKSFYDEKGAELDQMEKDGASEEEIQAVIDSANAELFEYFKNLLLENNDNYIGIYALRYLSSKDNTDDLLGLIGEFSAELQEDEYVKSVKTSIEAVEKTAEGMMFTDFTVNSVVGMTRSIPPQPIYGDVKLSDYVGKGKYVLVDFWASWCGPCKAEMPNLKNVYEKYQGDDFDMVSVAVWDKPEASLKAAEEVGMTWNHIVNAQNVPTDLYGIQGIPHIILFGPDGTILKRGLRGEAIGEEIAKYIGK